MRIIIAFCVLALAGLSPDGPEPMKTGQLTLPLRLSGGDGDDSSGWENITVTGEAPTKDREQEIRSEFLQALQETTEGSSVVKGSGGKSENLRLDLLKHLDDRSNIARVAATKKNDVIALPEMLNQRVVVLFVDGTNVAGTLLGHDRNANLLLDNCTERVFPPFKSLDSLSDEELLRDTATSYECDPYNTDLDHPLAEAAGLGCDDEMLLPLPGKMLIRGENVGMVLEVDTGLEEGQEETDPFPRLYAYATARAHRLKTLLNQRKFQGNAATGSGQAPVTQ